jgi:large subunit ribosomal protein L5
MAKNKETKGRDKGASKAAPASSAPARPTPEGYVPRLRQRYQEEVVPRLRKEFGIDNIMAVPRIEKVSLNMGVGDAIQNIKVLDDAVEELGSLAGQKPVITRAQKSIAAFKLRQGMPIGCRVTLRGVRMWEFLDRLLTVALPRIRDFRGLSATQFDGRGNYTFGLVEQAMFHEIDQDKVDRVRGMDITVVTSATTDDEGRSLLRKLGFPFKAS